MYGQESIVNFIKQLISVKSTADNPKGLDEVLKLACSKVRRFNIEEFEHNNIKSVLVHNSARRAKKYKVILNAHLDVVPGKDVLYNPKNVGNKLYGVGAWDMKAGAACLIDVFTHVAQRVTYPIGLQLTTDEEIGGFHGTKYQIDSGVRAEFVITGEPTNLNIANRAKGILWMQISCKGVTAHGAYPWRGSNAIWHMHTFLETLKRKWPLVTEDTWVSTYNVSSIQTTNSAFNKIPDSCSVDIDIRYIPQDKQKIIILLKRILPPNFRMDILVDEPGTIIDARNPYLKALHTFTSQVARKNIVIYGAHGSSDVRHYTRVGGGGVEFGPCGGNIGSDKEWVDIRSLSIYTQTLIEFLHSI